MKDDEASETNSQPGNKKERNQKDTSRLEESETEEDPMPHSSKELYLNKQTYTLPEKEENDVAETVTNKGKKNEIKPDSISLNVQKTESTQSVEENKIQENSHIYKACPNKETEFIGPNKSGISGNICLTSPISTDSFDSELNSDLSEDNEEFTTKKKEKDLVKADYIEDPEENFRRHFLKTFADIPRISQISLEDNPKDGVMEQNQKEGIQKTEMSSVSKTDIQQSTKENDSTSSSTIHQVEDISENLKNSQTDLNYKNDTEEDKNADQTNLPKDVI
ncbi:uncharacterized protein LOC108147883 [Drosophila elegans]|uniref:uncharacterized protein LOC108147883 n=1 Tax=Drosophila elegans TaxID=30023 RepID=UPI0007E7978C|nr:uncharacterized protein LOC108147883 [Drosophila elegans]